MSNFLPAGIIRDTIEEIYFKIGELVQSMDEAKGEGQPGWLEKATEVESLALDLALFLEKLSCQPLIYTGKGTTEEVVRKLDRAITLIDEFASIDLINQQKK